MFDFNGDLSKKKNQRRREVSEPPKVRVKTYAEKIYDEGDIIQLE